MSTILPTIELARAIGMDAGNASMRRGGRTEWSAVDRDAATCAYNAIYDLVYPDDAAAVIAAEEQNTTPED